MQNALIIILIAFLPRLVCGQRLLLQNDRHRYITYEQGDVIAFRLKGDKAKIKGQILSFQDSLIVFRGFTINPREISHMYVDKKSRQWFILRYKYSRMLLIGGAGYLLIDTINQGEVDDRTLLVGGALIGAGLLSRWLVSDRLRIKGRRKLMIISG